MLFTMLLRSLNGGFAGCSMGCGPKCILRLWLRVGVKHVAFYGLWPGMTSLELWFGIADEQEEPLSFCSCWRVLLV